MKEIIERILNLERRYRVYRTPKRIHRKFPGVYSGRAYLEIPYHAIVVFDESASENCVQRVLATLKVLREVHVVIGDVAIIKLSEEGNVYVKYVTDTQRIMPAKSLNDLHKSKEEFLDVIDRVMRVYEPRDFVMIVVGEHLDDCTRIYKNNVSDYILLSKECKLLD